MDATLILFLLRYLGVPNTGTNAANKGQCVGLVQLWWQQHGLPFVGGNAVDLLNNADLTHYRLIRNLPNNFPPPGAVVCWDASWGNGYGHTALVIGATSMLLVVFEQNDPDGSPPIVATHSYQGVAGWLVQA